MSLIKFSFSLFSLGSAAYVLYQIGPDTPEWIKKVSYILAIAALLAAVQPYLEMFGVPSAFGSFVDMLRTVGNRQAEDQRNQLDWTFSKRFYGGVYVKLFTADGVYGYQPEGKAWFFDDGGPLSVRISCRYQEQICYGAFTADRNSSWGLGEDGSGSCSSCCATCGYGAVSFSLVKR